LIIIEFLATDSICRLFVDFLATDSICRLFVDFLATDSICRLFVDILATDSICRLFVDFLATESICRLCVRDNTLILSGLEIAHETAIRQTEIPTLLDSWVTSTPFVKMLCPQKKNPSHIFVKT
jgi:hypothetical protein